MQIRAQDGPQEAFLASNADVVIYGGAAGGGKSFALLLEPLRHAANPKFGGVIFRRSTPQLTGAGSLWEDASRLYPLLGATLREHPYLEVTFPSGASLQFTHLQHIRDVYTHHGKAYAFVAFDELSHFEPFQFWYLVSRMRSMAGVAPYMRCTTNPDPDSFVRKLIAWWIGDPDCDDCKAGSCREVEHGYPNPERSGVLRWFVRRGDVLEWADTREELIERFGENCNPLSLTFIGAKLEDNPALVDMDPGYRGRLEAMPEIEKQRLLGGNWNIRPVGGKYIMPKWFRKRWTRNPEMVSDDIVLLPQFLNRYGSSDFAVMEPQTPDDDPDFTEHGFVGVDDENDIYVLDWWYGQTTSDVWIDSLLDMVVKHRPDCWFGEGGVIRRAIEPALNKRIEERRVWFRAEWINPAGRVHTMGSSLEGFADRSKQAKAIRGRAFQARASRGKIIFPVNADWLVHVLASIVKFPAKGHDDSFDVLSQLCLGLDEIVGAVQPIEEEESDRDRWQREPTGSWMSK